MSGHTRDISAAGLGCACTDNFVVLSFISFLFLIHIDIQRKRSTKVDKIDYVHILHRMVGKTFFLGIELLADSAVFRSGAYMVHLS